MVIWIVKKSLTPNYGWRKQPKCIFDSDRRLEFCRIRDIRVRDIEIRLYYTYCISKRQGPSIYSDTSYKICMMSKQKSVKSLLSPEVWDRHVQIVPRGSKLLYVLKGTKSKEKKTLQSRFKTGLTYQCKNCFNIDRS